MLKKLFSFVANITVFLILAYLCLMNQQSVQLRLNSYDAVELPFYIIILSVFLLGYLFSWIPNILKMAHLKMQSRSLQKKLQKQGDE